MLEPLMNETAALRRRPDHGGYARGEETRARIVAAAIKVFGEAGYVGASTRVIAAEAGVNPPALQYYFASKEGLHRACAEFIAEHVKQTLDPALHAGVVAMAAGNPAGAVDALCDILDTLADISINPSGAGQWKRFVARSLADGAGPGFPSLREALTNPLNAVCAALVGLALGQPAESEATRLRTLMILSQLSSLHTQGERALYMLGWPDFSDDRLARFKAAMRLNTKKAIGPR